MGSNSPFDESSWSSDAFRCLNVSLEIKLSKTKRVWQRRQCQPIRGQVCKSPLVNITSSCSERIAIFKHEFAKYMVAIQGTLQDGHHTKASQWLGSTVSGTCRKPRLTTRLLLSSPNKRKECKEITAVESIANGEMPKRGTCGEIFTERTWSCRALQRGVRWYGRGS